MIKLAFFVEGQTERIFLEKLFQEYLTPPLFDIESQRIEGDGLVQLKKPINHLEAEIYLLIYEMTGGERVVSALLNRAEKMIMKANYNCLFALRDLFPETREKKGEIIRSVKKIFSEQPFSDRLKHVLAVMEIEAWFLTDSKMFQNIDTKLTPQFIKDNVGIDLISDNPESYPHPAKTIDDVYKLIGKRYKKREKQSYQIVHSLDFEQLCIVQRENRRTDSLCFFLDCLDSNLPN